MQPAIEPERQKKTRRPRKKEFQVDELPEAAKERVLEKHRGWNVEYCDWAECTIDAFKEKLGSLGFLDPETYYSGFWSQGDGASFKAEVDIDIYIRAHLEDLIKARVDIFTLRQILNRDSARDDWEMESHHITQSGHYYHEKTMDIDLGWRGDAPKNIEDALTQMQGFILKDARDLAKGFYKSLGKEYDYLTSDEAIIESLNANDKKFTRDGEDI